MQLAKQISDLKNLAHEINEDFSAIKKLVYKVIKNNCGTVLVLDDDITVTNLITKILNLHDFKVNVNISNDIESFKNKLENQKDIRMVILDFYLYDITAEAIALELKNKNIPTIIISGSINENINKFCYEHNFKFISKPINCQYLHSIVKDTLLRVSQK